MIKSSRHILRFSNKAKIDQLEILYNEYMKILQYYIDLILKEELPLNKFLSSKELPNHDKVNSSFWKQIAYKQASEIVRSNLKIVKNKVFKRYKQLYAICFSKKIHNQFVSKTFSQLYVNYLKRIVISVKNISIPIDSRLFDTIETTTFDEFIRIRKTYIEEGQTKKDKCIRVPIKYHRVSNNLKNDGWTRKNTIQLKKIKGQFYIILFWQKNDVLSNNNDTKVGIDIGYNKLISTSTGHHYGVNLKLIYDKICDKKQGSKNSKRALIQRDEEINRIAKDFIVKEKPKIVYIEDLKYLNVNNKKGNKISRWTYGYLIKKLDQLSKEKGFQIVTVNPKYTSQTCSKCGSSNKKNRNGEIYYCNDCNTKIDADYNASINILHKGLYGTLINKSK